MEESHMLKSKLHLRTVAAVIGCLGASGCWPVTRNGSEGFERRATPTRTSDPESSRFFINQADILIADVESVDDVVRRLRPDWLRASPTQRQGSDMQRAMIYVDDLFLGGLETLRLVKAAEARSVEYLPPMAARGRYGPACDCAGGAIVISKRAPR
jgi:hypothetical protein